ncbi:chloride channel protein [Cutibacterium acnes JCM 18920]|nr:chloride channel protein [Cutibacterium acnes JCM 18920]
MAAYGTVIGIVSGVGAIIFFFCLKTGTHWLLETLGGYTPPGTLGEGGGVAGTRLTRPWAIPLIVAGGALVSGTLVYFVAPTAKGHGTDNAIDAVHHDPTALKGKVAAVKIIASSLVIGSGGSGGREGPTAQISATVISSLCKKLKIATPDARIAVSAATASGIGAIFRAPLGGALLGAELLYRDDMESDAIMPSLVSSIVAFVVFGSVYGFEPIFGSLSGVQFSQPLQLIWFVLLGLTAGSWASFMLRSSTAAPRFLTVSTRFLAGSSRLSVVWESGCLDSSYRQHWAPVTAQCNKRCSPTTSCGCRCSWCWQSPSPRSSRRPCPSDRAVPAASSALAW